MNAGCRLKLEWIPEAYRTADNIDNESKNIAEQPPLSAKSKLYGHSLKKYSGRQRYPKK